MVNRRKKQMCQNFSGILERFVFAFQYLSHNNLTVSGYMCQNVFWY